MPMPESTIASLPETARYVVNGRLLAHRVTGVQRYAREISARLPGQPELLEPGRDRQWGRGALGHLWEQLVLPRRAAGRLLWSPCAAGPVSYRRQVVTFHDLFALEHPEWFSPGYAQGAHRPAARAQPGRDHGGPQRGFRPDPFDLDAGSLARRGRARSALPALHPVGELA